VKLGDADRAPRPKVKRAWIPPEPGPVPERAQLMAIAGDMHDPTIDDGEWSARIKDRIARLGLSPASADSITATIRLLSKRLTRNDPLARVNSDPNHSAAPRFTRDEAAAFNRDIESRFARTRVLP
jgi:hypothetical protein